MYELEFNEVLKEFCINNYVMEKRNNTIRSVYFWNNIEIYFGGSYYAVINGKIPLKVANTIYKKYPNNPYGIRIDGGCIDYIPIEHAVDDKFKKEVGKGNFEKRRKELLKRKNKKKYIEVYHIDSKEGLIILLSELKDYYARKQGLPEIEVKRYNEIESNVSSEILKKVNPDITTCKWMEGADTYNHERFLNTVSQDNSTPFQIVFRRAIDQFDKTVNPYINEDIELDSIDNYLQRVNISANTYDMEDDKYRENCCCMEIKEKNGKNRVVYYRSPNGFSYQLKYILGPGEYFEVIHYFKSNGNKESDLGEHIYINHSIDSKTVCNLRYNITQGLFGESYKDKVPVTSDIMVFVYDQLQKATKLASTITIDNMKKKEYSKKLVPDQN